MSNCIIRPIPLFQTRSDKSRMTYYFNFGQQITLVNYVWYIEGASRRILVDAGGSSEFISSGGVAVEDIQTLDSGLSKLGLDFSDIELIILTHLHHDHVAQVSRFPRAKVLIQRDELQFAQSPHPATTQWFLKKFFDELNFELISGDVEISKEISVLRTPGHSLGGQSVAIKTEQGIVVIAGLCTIRENFEPPRSIRKLTPLIPPGLHINVLDAYDSMVRIKQVADIVVTPHDPECRQKSSIP